MKRSILAPSLLGVTLLLMTISQSSVLAGITAPSPVINPLTETQKKLPAVTVDDNILTLGYLSALLSRIPRLHTLFLNNASRQDTIEKIIDKEMLAIEAKKRGYDTHQKVAAELKTKLAAIMHKRITTAVLKTTVTDEQLRAYYDKNITLYKRPEKVRIRHILFSNKTDAQKLLTQIVQQPVSPHKFRSLAKEKSEDTERKNRRGDMNFITKDNIQIAPEIIKAAFKLKKNSDVYPNVIKTKDGFHIIMRTAHQEAMDLSFEDAKERLYNVVQRKVRKNQVANAIQKLKERFLVKIYEENLKYVTIDLSSNKRAHSRNHAAHK